MASDRYADAALMRCVAEGESFAFRRIVEQHAPRMYGLAYRMVGDKTLSEDVVQEAFLRLWRQARLWRPEARIATWLYRVVHNICIDELRARRRLSDQEIPEQIDPADGPLTRKHRGQVAAEVRAAIAALPVRQRVAITLVHHQEMSNIEAAEIMQVTIDALESLLVRGRRNLKRQLAARREDLVGEP